MKILITGIHGFVGNYLTNVLSAHNTLYGIDIVFPAKAGVERTYRWEDLEKNVVPQADAIIHLAGKAHDTKNQTAVEAYFKVNTGLTKKAYDYFLSSDAEKFIFFSSVKAVADKVEGEVLTEDATPRPRGPYGESKLAAEEYIQSRMAEASRRGKKTYILRPCMIHGPGNKGNLNLLYSVVKRGFPWPLGAFENKRTFTSIDNLCYVVEGLLENNIDSGVYNMNDDEALSTNELIELICHVLHKKPNIRHLNPKLMEVCAEIGTALRLPLNTERLSKLTENYVSSNAKIKTALHIDKMPVRAVDGLTKTILSFSRPRSEEGRSP